MKKTLARTVLALWLGAVMAPVMAHPHNEEPAQKASAADVSVQLDEHTREDMERHQAMAKAHGDMAQCLAAGTDMKECQKQLQAACKGLALGKNCGMRHSH